MAWTYSDWRQQSTPALRRTWLALYIQELEDALKDRSVGLGADGKSQSKEGILELIRMAKQDFDAMPSSGGGFMKIRRSSV